MQKKAKVSEEERPYVPPMGNLSAGSKPAPRLMLTNGSSAPGAAIAAARKQSSTNAFSHLDQSRASMFGGRLVPFKLGQEKVSTMFYRNTYLEYLMSYPQDSR